MENKNSFFEVTVPLNVPNDQLNYTRPFRFERINNQMDLIFHESQVEDDYWKFEGENDVCFFLKPIKRKRKGQIIKACQKHLDKIEKGLNFEVYSYTKDNFFQQMDIVSANENYRASEKGKSIQRFKSDEYRGEDIQFFTETIRNL